MKLKPSWHKRFWAKVEKGAGSGCWEWIAGKTKDGYGQLRINGVSYYAHRLSFGIANGPIPEGMDVLHTCDNPACIKPVHLFLGTQSDNVKDAAKKGRMPKGSAHWKAVLTPDRVLELRRRKKNEKITYKQLGLEYHMHPAWVRDVVIGKLWGWLS